MESVLEMEQVFFFLQPKTKPPNSLTDKAMYSCQALSTPDMCNRINSQIKSGCKTDFLKSQVRKYSRACPISPLSLITGCTSISVNPKSNFVCSPLPNTALQGKRALLCICSNGIWFPSRGNMTNTSTLLKIVHTNCITPTISLFNQTVLFTYSFFYQQLC